MAGLLDETVNALRSTLRKREAGRRGVAVVLALLGLYLASERR